MINALRLISARASWAALAVFLHLGTFRARGVWSSREPASPLLGVLAADEDARAKSLPMVPESGARPLQHASPVLRSLLCAGKQGKLNWECRNAATGPRRHLRNNSGTTDKLAAT